MKFTEISQTVTVAVANHGVMDAQGFVNSSLANIFSGVKMPSIGDKDGAHFLRTQLACTDTGECLTRSNKNLESSAQLLIIDCDKRINDAGEVLEGAPDPAEVSRILKAKNIGHILYGSHSHYTGTKGNRYRILLPTATPYTNTELKPTLEALIGLINAELAGDQLVNATENLTWSQPWYFARKPLGSTIANLYHELIDGDAVPIAQPLSLPLANKSNRPTRVFQQDEISPITAFNAENSIADLLKHYGYKRVYTSNEYERWLSPDSKSGIPGITVKDGKFYSHHSDIFNDGYWHDAFDLMKTKENLTETEAIIFAAKNTRTPTGETVDEHNKSLLTKKHNQKNKAASPIPHTQVLNALLHKITPIDFRKLANLKKDNESLKRNHFYILTIETILKASEKYNWGMCRNHDFIYVYNGTHWNLIDKDDLKSFLGLAAEKMGVEKFIAQDHLFRELLYKQFLAAAHLPKPEQSAETLLINLQNGTFEITPAGTNLKPFSRDDFLTYQLPFPYSKTATAPLFQAYLDKVLPDKSLQLVVAEYIGYIFIQTRTLKLEKALILYGTGANGKSVFYEIIRKLLGEQNTSEYSLQALTDDKGYQRAMIANKLVNYASEINGKLESSIFKQLVSGEAVEARLPYGNPFIINNYAKLIFNCNELPKDVEHTEAYFRRFLIIPFEVTIPENQQDKELAKKIIATELSGVFNWALEGLTRLLTQKQFTHSEKIQQVRVNYEKESDSTRLFLEECGYIPSISDYIAIKILYPEYREFCQENGYHPLNKLNFRKRLESAKIITSTKNCGNVAFLGKNKSYAEGKWGE